MGNVGSPRSPVEAPGIYGTLWSCVFQHALIFSPDWNDGCLLGQLVARCGWQTTKHLGHDGQGGLASVERPTPSVCTPKSCGIAEARLSRTVGG